MNYVNLKVKFLNPFILYIFSCASINMSRIKLYQQNIIKKIKKDYKKKLLKNIKICLKKKKRKNDNMVVNVTKIFRKMKHKSLLSTEEILQNEKKRCIIKIMTHKVPLKVYIERDKTL